jgi:hypothetical protein
MYEHVMAKMIIEIEIIYLISNDRYIKPIDESTGQAKNYKIGICCFSVEHVALRKKSKDWFDWNQNNASE